MNKFDELLNKLKELSIIQTQSDWAENLPEDIWKNYFEANFSEIKKNLDVDKHRWYETSTSVIKIYDRFLGINFITDLFSESGDYESCYHQIWFGEMKKVQTITYEPI